MISCFFPAYFTSIFHDQNHQLSWASTPGQKERHFGSDHWELSEPETFAVGASRFFGARLVNSQFVWRGALDFMRMSPQRKPTYASTYASKYRNLKRIQPLVNFLWLFCVCHCLPGSARWLVWAWSMTGCAISIERRRWEKLLQAEAETLRFSLLYCICLFGKHAHLTAYIIRDRSVNSANNSKIY